MTTGKNKQYDIVVVGGGIVGVSTAWQIKQHFPDAGIILVEKEKKLASHQTGHNSGVVHAGVYYQPGSLKAKFCKRGAADTKEFCKKHHLPLIQCGKLLVATNQMECKRMEALERNCTINGIKTAYVNEKTLKKREPNIRGKAAVWVSDTAITDYRRITNKMADIFRSDGGMIRTGTKIFGLEEKHDHIVIKTNGGTFKAAYLLVCGGLMADRLVRMMGISADFSIVPFRGEYYRLKTKHNGIVNHLIYPIPDPELPFLGVHLTRMIDGSVTVGPNAVLGWKREGYGRFNANCRDIFDMMTFPGFWKVIRKNFLSGLKEMNDSVFRSGYLERVRKYCPRLSIDDLLAHPPGIRAQAVKSDGTLIHDFLFAESERSLHVCNAPSPAATAAIPIGSYLCEKFTETFKL